MDVRECAQLYLYILAGQVRVAHPVWFQTIHVLFCCYFVSVVVCDDFQPSRSLPDTSLDELHLVTVPDSQGSPNAVIHCRRGMWYGFQSGQNWRDWNHGRRCADGGR